MLGSSDRTLETAHTIRAQSRLCGGPPSTSQLVADMSPAHPAVDIDPKHSFLAARWMKPARTAWSGEIGRHRARPDSLVLRGRHVPACSWHMVVQLSW